MTDYDIYDLSVKEALLFYGAGYGALFILGYIFYSNIFLSAILGVTIVFFRKAYTGFLVSRRKERLLLGFKDLLYSLSSSIAVGRTMGEALCDGYEYLTGIYDDDQDIIIELRNITGQVSDGRCDETQLLRDFADRSHLEDISGFADVYETVRDTGGDLDNVITSTSRILMDKIMIDREIRTIISQKKLESAIIAVMPLVIIGGMNISSSSYLEPMYETLAGRLIMTAALAGFAVSYYLILKITDIRI